MKISLICVSALIASLGHAQSNWDGFGTVRMSIHETGTLTNSKTYTVLRQGSSSRIEGAYPVFGALAKLPHVEIATAKNAFLYVPDLKAALRILDPSGVDRVAATYPTRIKRDLFAAPKELLEKELKKPAKLEGQEKVAGRDCYVLTTTNPKSDVHQEKQWIDTKTGLVLKYQRIEAGKVVYERATTEVAFNPPTLAANFELPLGTLHINGPVSTQAVENLTKLEDATAYQAAMKGIEEKDKDKRAWISRIDPPAGLQHANSDFRTIFRSNLGGGASNGAGGPIPPGQARVFTAKSGDGEHDIVFVTATTDDLPVAEGTGAIELKIAFDTDDGQHLEFQGPDGIKLTPHPLTINQIKQLQSGQWLNDDVIGRILGMAGQARTGASGALISEFIDPKSGSSMVFYQSNTSDPTNALAPKATFGDPETIDGNGRKFSYYHSDTAGDVLVWKSGLIWYAIGSAGVAKEDLIKAAATVRGLD